MPKTKTRRKPKIANVYEVTLHGIYYKEGGGSEGKAGFENYEITIKMNDKHKDAGFVSVFKNHVAGKLMPLHVKGYLGLYTHNLKSVKNLTNPDAVNNDPTIMSLQELAGYVEYHELPIELGLYREREDLMQAVLDCEEDEDAFLKNQESRLELRREGLELEADLADLNDGFGTPRMAPISLNPKTVPEYLAKPSTDEDDDTEYEEDPTTGELVPVDRFDEDELDGDDEEEPPAPVRAPARKTTARKSTKPARRTSGAKGRKKKPSSDDI